MSVFKTNNFFWWTHTHTHSKSMWYSTYFRFFIINLNILKTTMSTRYFLFPAVMRQSHRCKLQGNKKKEHDNGFLLQKKKIAFYVIFIFACKGKHKKVLIATSHFTMCHSELEQAELRQHRYLLSPICSLFSGWGDGECLTSPLTGRKERALPCQKTVLYYIIRKWFI